MRCVLPGTTVRGRVILGLGTAPPGDLRGHSRARGRTVPAAPEPVFPVSLVCVRLLVCVCRCSALAGRWAEAKVALLSVAGRGAQAAAAAGRDAAARGRGARPAGGAAAAAGGGARQARRRSQGSGPVGRSGAGAWPEARGGSRACSSASVPGPETGACWPTSLSSPPLPDPCLLRVSL